MNLRIQDIGSSKNMSLIENDYTFGFSFKLLIKLGRFISTSHIDSKATINFML